MSSLAGLSGAAAAAVAKAAPGAAQLDDAALGKLVAAHQLSDAQASALGLSAALYQLSDGNSALATALKSASFAALGNRPAASVAELSRVPAGELIQAITAGHLTLPGGATAAQVGAALGSRLSSVSPLTALFGRLPPVNVTQVGSDLSALAPLFAHNGNVLSVDFDALNQTGIDPAQLPTLKLTQERLLTLARSYPGMQLAQLLDSNELSPSARAAEAKRRVALVDTVAKKLGGGQPLRLDLSDATAASVALGLGALDASDADRAMVLATFKAYQRAYAVANNVDDAHLLLQKGYLSGQQIGQQHFGAFQTRSGLDAVKAKRIWDRARTSLADVTMTVGSILDAMHGLFDVTAVDNTPLSAQQYLKQLAGYQDLFGSLSFCDCQECQSILGPAAYFVDLMKYIDENLRDQFATLPPNHPLDLKTRRPDLWTLELSCDNTNDRVATLDLVNQILENYIAQKLGYTGSLDDRNAIATLVYENTLQTEVDSFAQPLMLPEVRIRSYLAELGQTRSEVATALAAPVDAWTDAELDLSAEERQLVTSAQVDLTQLGRLYGISFGGTANAVTQLDAQLLAAAMGLTRAELGAVVGSAFVAAGGATVHIQARQARRRQRAE